MFSAQGICFQREASKSNQRHMYIVRNENNSSIKPLCTQMYNLKKWHQAFKLKKKGGTENQTLLSIYYSGGNKDTCKLKPTNKKHNKKNIM